MSRIRTAKQMLNSAVLWAGRKAFPNLHSNQPRSGLIQLPGPAPVIVGNSPFSLPLNSLMSGEETALLQNLFPKKEVTVDVDLEGGEKISIPIKIEVGGSVIGADGEYYVVRELSEGGMGKTFIVTDKEGTQHILKQFKLSPEFAGMEEKMQARFETELKLLGLMDSDYTPRLVDYDDETYSNFFIQEMVEGKSLSEWMGPKKKFSPNIACRIVYDVLFGLNDFAAAMETLAEALPEEKRATLGRFAHRDIKPDNILVILDGNEYERSVIIDFGVAKVVGSKQTQLFQFLGTGGFQAPETFDAGSSEVDQRADIFVLSLLLFWLIAGLHPLSDDQAVLTFGRNKDEYMDNWMRNLPDTVSSDLRALIRQGLRYKPEDRIPNYQIMMDTLYHLI